ncbi:hypothetical protein Btru_050718 [Bulinus truncatus]|nr:hypothetical protein Btru_050718 [Bulinus truncatus]
MTTAPVPNISVNEGTKDDGNGQEVVLRKSKKCCQLSLFKEDTSKPGEKRVKWSESTELREKMKVYRRSQINIPLDYHHIALDEEREKEGVNKWRSSLHKDEDDDEQENETEKKELVLSQTDDSAGAESESESTDSDERDPVYQLDLDMMLHVIKIKTTKFTVYPAYCSAVNVYEEWLSNSSNTNSLSQETLKNMKTQLALYKNAVLLYEQWADQDDDKTSCAKYEEIDSLLKKAAEMGFPPEVVSKAINDVMYDEDNSQKQVDVYNNMVQEMITSLDSIEV